MEQNYRTHYAAHVTEVQNRWEQALEAEHFSAVLVHSGSPLYSFLDDYEYAFRPNPHFLSWLPLTRHPDSALLMIPGRRPVLFYYQPVDYWYLPPADPEAYWADQFDQQHGAGTVVDGRAHQVDNLFCRYPASGIARGLVVE